MEDSSCYLAGMLFGCGSKGMHLACPVRFDSSGRPKAEVAVGSLGEAVDSTLEVEEIYSLGSARTPGSLYVGMNRGAEVQYSPVD